MSFPRLLPVHQSFPSRALPDVRSAVCEELLRSGLASRRPPGAEIAIGVGSRGVANLDLIVRAVVDYWRSQGHRPFVFPAMGSHGAATAAGQAEVLARYGIDEATMGCPVRSSLEVVPLGATPEGIETVMDRLAHASDGVFLVNRIKWHTSFSGRLESGLCKMMAIGLGKLAGAQRYHAHGYGLGMEAVVRSVGRRVLGTGRVLGGLGILEDAHHQTALVAAVPAETLEEREEELLALTKTWMPALPVPALDILMVDQMGKNISGTGMDTKVVNRSVRAEYNPYAGMPRVERIFVRSLSEETHGNAVGIGMADVVHDRVLGQVDWPTTWVNSLTASSPTGSRLPIHFPSDRECLERIAPTVGKLDLSCVTLGWIRDSLTLDRMWLSENLRPEIDGNPLLSIEGESRPLPFDDNGDLGRLPG